MLVKWRGPSVPQRSGSVVLCRRYDCVAKVTPCGASSESSQPEHSRSASRGQYGIMARHLPELRGQRWLRGWDSGLGDCMHADVDADDDGCDSDGEAASGVDQAGNRLGSVVPQVLTDAELRIMRSAIEQSAPLKPLTEAAQSFSRQILQQSKLDEMIRENFLGGLMSSLEVGYGLNVPRIHAAEFVAANLAAVNLRGLDQLTAVSGLHAQHAMTARWAESALGFGALTSWRASLQVDSRPVARILCQKC